jgi:hypothetical protein
LVDLRDRDTLTRLFNLVLIATLVALTPAAFASPPDPTWIAGLYDNGDHDDVILLVTSTSSTPVELSARVVQPDLVAADPRADVRARIDVCPTRAFQSRAPPVI